MGKISGKKDIRFETFAVKSDWSFSIRNISLKQMCLLMSALVQNLGASQEEAEERARMALAHVGFPEKSYKSSPFGLSGGQKEEWQLPEF